MYQFIKIIGKNDFPNHFKKIIVRYKKIVYSIDVVRQTASLVVNSLLLLCSDSRNDVPPVPQRNVSIAAERGAVRPSTGFHGNHMGQNRTIFKYHLLRNHEADKFNLYGKDLSTSLYNFFHGIVNSIKVNSFAYVFNW